MKKRPINVVGDLVEAVGLDVECETKIMIDQERINAFAETCGDTQWIHVDADRASRDSPFGTTIAHGLLLVAMCPMMLRSAFDLKGVERGVMYGLDRVRFPAPVLVGSTLSAVARVLEVTPAPGGARASIQYRYTSENTDRPHCVADMIHQFVFRDRTGENTVDPLSEVVQ